MELTLSILRDELKVFQKLGTPEYTLGQIWPHYVKNCFTLIMW